MQENDPIFQSIKRHRLLKLMKRFDGNVDQIRECFLNRQAKCSEGRAVSMETRRQQREELRTVYATQLAELKAAGIDVESPRILAHLEKHHGNINKVSIIIDFAFFVLFLESSIYSCTIDLGKDGMSSTEKGSDDST